MARPLPPSRCGTRYPEFREVTERLAKEFGLGMSGYFGEASHDPQYSARPQDKTDSLVAMIDRLGSIHITRDEN